MCGRFAQAIPLKDLIKLFFTDEIKTDIDISYNIAPSQQVAALIKKDEKRILGDLRWGLIPSWAKDDKIGYKMINARGETVHEKPSFKKAFQSRRCIIPATGFYEWQKTNDAKQPWYITTKDREVMAMAGLYEIWKSPQGETISSCTIITTEANDTMKPIHNRMPVIISPDSEDQWLSASAEDALHLIKPWNNDDMTLRKISTYVNSPQNNDDKCLEPIE